MRISPLPTPTRNTNSPQPNPAASHDTKGEEMLMCDRDAVRMLYDRTDSVKVRQTLESLFGPKCLRDNVDSLSQKFPEKYDKANRISTDDNKPSEPKFKVGDHVRVISADKYGESGYIVKVDEEDDGFFYTIAGIKDWRFFEPNLELYAEPEEKSRNLSQNIVDCDKMVDNILKDSSRNERRLNIATQIMSSILSNQMMLNNLAHGETTVDGVVRCIVNTTMMYTDALIAECERSEKLKEN